MKKFISALLSLTMIMAITSTTAFAAEPTAAKYTSPNNMTYTESSDSNLNSEDTLPSEQPNNPYISPENYIKYLESFGDEYSSFLSQFKALPIEKQQKMLDVLLNGGTLDVTISKPTVSSSSIAPFSNQRSVWAEADYQLFGITFVTVRLEGRFTYSGATVKSAEYKNAYIVKNWIPLTGFERSALDAYVSGGKFYANAAFTAYVGAKIGDNVIGVTPRTFYINLTSDGYGNVTGSAS